MACLQESSYINKQKSADSCKYNICINWMLKYEIAPNKNYKITTFFAFSKTINFVENAVLYSLSS